MNHKQNSLLVMGTLLLSTILIAGCTQSLSNSPAATATLIPTGLFVSPFPSVENPMDMIQKLAQETSAAQTATASGGTPAAPTTPITAEAGTTTGTAEPSTPTNVGIPTTPVAVVTTVTPGGPTSTPVAPGVRPATYNLQKEEFPYCIARRFDVDPQKLLQLSGLTSPDIYYAGLKLTIPQSGSWPGSAALRNHPDTYTVTGNEDITVYGVACKYGNVTPEAIASANGISVSAKLTIGQKLQIP